MIHNEFIQHYRNNPQLWTAIVKYSLELQKARNRGGLRTVMERIRWDTMIGVGQKPYKISDRYTAYYARLLMWKYPVFRGFFRLKRVQIDGTSSDIYDVSTWNQIYWNQF